MYPAAHQAAPYDLTPGDFAEFDITAALHTEPIPTLPDGSKPKYIAVQTGQDGGYKVAFGDSNIDASTDPQFAIAEGSDPVYVNVWGMTHWSVDGVAGGAGAIMMCPLGDF